MRRHLSNNYGLLEVPKYLHDIDKWLILMKKGLIKRIKRIIEALRVGNMQIKLSPSEVQTLAPK